MGLGSVLVLLPTHNDPGAQGVFSSGVVEVGTGSARSILTVESDRSFVQKNDK